MTPLCLILSALAAEPRVLLEDVGRVMPDARPALIVVTPGVPVSAYLSWTRAIEDAGLDAWVARAPSRGQEVEEIVAGVEQAFAKLAEERGAVAVAAHGYGGVFVRMAQIEPARLALVAVPLDAHPVHVEVAGVDTPVAEQLPWAPELLGGLPAEPYSGALSRAYARWAVDYPERPPPSCPSLLMSSTADPVAPPELMRLPSADWPERTWVRRGPLSLDETEDPTHAELLLAPESARQVARFLSQGGWG